MSATFKDIRVNSWAAFEQAIAEDYQLRRENSRSHLNVSEVLFRGHANADWPLQTTLERFTGATITVKSYLSLLRRIQPYVQSLTNKSWPVPENWEGPEDYINNLPAYEFM